ncbi:MAG: aminodeoxychorismate/anthranilate synthase component II [Bacteroidales bacterium]|nr:aminodeoxychorismate/anthranilate synthase component II [Bacteroidales bacterium]
MKILIIDNYDSFTYNLAQLIEQTGNTFEIIKKDKVNIDEINDYKKILFSPGPGLPNDSNIMFNIIKKYHRTKSILGICLGHQAIAEYFGCKISHLDKIMHGVSSKINILDDNDYIFKNIPQNFAAARYHSWIVDSNNFSEQLKITSVDQDDNIMSISHKTYDIKGLQFHPESIITDFGVEIISNWISHK